VWPVKSGETSRLGSMDPVARRDQVRAAWWQEKQGDGFLVELVQGSSSQPKSARRVWLVYSTKPTPSRDDVAAKS
jgi:hypothetical protein